jgi:uncharacterized protein DUF481
MRSRRSGRRHAVLVARLAIALGVTAACRPGRASAEKTDLVILRNGDRITGEIKALAHGKLDYNTDDAGRLSIEWDKVARITSPHQFEFLLGSGIKYFGRPGIPNRDGVVVVLARAADTLSIPSVVEISPINAAFLERLQSYLDVGLTVAKANQATTFSLSGAADYRGPQLGSQLKFDSYAQGQESVPTTTRNSLRQSFSWYLPSRWSAVGLLQLEQNDELDLDHRFTGGGAMSRALAHTNRMEFSVGGGLVGTQEQFSASTGNTSDTSLEGLLAANWSAFRFDSPKLDFSLSAAFFPSLSQAGRIRGQTEFRLKYELFKDFNAGILFTDTFDSRPPNETASKNDYVTTLTIGWSYRR